MAQVSQQEYDQMNKEASRATKSYKTLPGAFFIGGLICMFGEMLLKWYLSMGINEKDAATLVSVTLIFLTALFTGFSLFNKLAKVAGAGTLVPITGFANSMVSPALEFKSEGFVLGLGAKMFIIAGPVIVYGLAASVLYGLVLYILQFFIKI